MSSCINLNNLEFKDLQEQTNINKHILAAKIKVWMEENNQDRFPSLQELRIPTTEVNAGLKALDILNSDKAIEIFAKGEKNKWSLNEILTKLQIPKEQKNILLEQKDQSREGLITSLFQNYSYTIEINTAKTLNGETLWSKEESFGLIPGTNEEVISHTVYSGSNHIKSFNTKEEADNFISKHQVKNELTQYYSYLTVPGFKEGTYRELRFTTPLITPSIKGHAQFAESNDIGWARVADTDPKTKYTDKDGNVFTIENGLIVFEEQSDLFQKGRDKEDLINKTDKNKLIEFLKNKEKYLQQLNNELEEIKRLKEDDLIEGKLADIKQQENIVRINKQNIDNFERFKQLPDNQFLQLFNKDNNWVTFFVKSIIADSAKKGYESVLFPSGNTIIQIESHNRFKTYEEAEKHYKDESWILEDERLRETLKEYQEEFENRKISKKNTKDIEQAIIKQKERIRSHQPTLLNTANFYEYELANRLDDLAGGNKNNRSKDIWALNQVTDEYGSTWNKINIKPDRDNQTILFQKEGLKQSEASHGTVELAKEILKRSGVDIKELEQYAKQHKINVNGVNGLADLTEKVIALAEEKQGVAITEETMHIAVGVIKQTNPKLYQELRKEVVKYNFYKPIFEEYRKDEDYQTKEGKPDVEKIQEEAIGKIMAEHFINNNEGFTERPELLQKTQSLFERIKSFLLKLFKGTGIDIFANTAENIANNGIGDTSKIKGGVFKQKENTQENIVNTLREINRNTTKIPSATLKDENSKPRDVYVYKGKEMLKRVSDLSKKFYESVFRDKGVTESEYQKLVKSITAETGTDIHSDLESVINFLTDENGKFINTELNENYIPKTSKEIYKQLFDNVKERMQTYPGAAFLTESKIVDEKENVGGTLDVIVVKEDGKIQILDWKSINLNTDKYSDIPWYKTKAWNIQIGEYRRILSKILEIPVSDIKGEAIPIKTTFRHTAAKIDGKQVPPVLEKIEIGKVNPKLEEKDYLLPVKLNVQSTDNKKLDEIIFKLNGLKKNLETRDVRTVQAKENKAEQLQAIDKAIRYLQVKHSIEPLIRQADIYTKDVRILIDTFNNNYKDMDFGKALDESQDFLKNLNEYCIQLTQAYSQLSIYDDLDVQLSSLQGTDISEEVRQLHDKLEKTSKDVRFLESALRETTNELGEKIANSQGYKSILDPELQVSSMGKLFVETSRLGMKTTNTLYEIRRRQANLAEIAINEQNNELLTIAKEYEILAKTEGFNKHNYFNLVMDYAKNKLVNQFDNEYYQGVKKAIENIDLKWIKENINLIAFKKELQDELDKNIETIKARTWSNEEKEEAIEKEREKYSTGTIQSQGWFAHKYILYHNPIEEKWTSKEWKELNKPQNSAAKKLYDWIIKTNERAEQAGYLPQGEYVKSFLPYIAKTMMEKFVFGGDMTLAEGFLKGMTIDESSLEYTNKDPLTGEVIHNIPKYFTHNYNNSELSVNLFSNLAKYNTALNNYSFIADTEGIYFTLLNIERNKSSIETNAIGQALINKETGESVKIQNNQSNAVLFEKQGNRIIHGQKYADSEGLDTLLGKTPDLLIKINKLLGYKLFPETFNDRQFSFNKSFDALNNYFRMKTIGFAPLTGLGHFLGSTLSLGVNAEKYMSSQDKIASELLLDTSFFKTSEGEKVRAAFKYFLPFTDKKANHELEKELSISKWTSANISDALMIFLRAGDKHSQSVTFTALLKNAIVVDGKIYNAREYIRQNTDYKNRYDNGNIRITEKDFEKLVTKAIEEHGLLNKSTVVNGELNIPGITRTSKTALDLKNLSQDLTKRITGNMNESETRGMNQNIWWNSAAIFRGWIPTTLSLRWAGLNYSSDVHAYEWGKSRTMLRIMSIESYKSIGKMINMCLFLNEKNALESLNKLYEYKKQQYLKIHGTELEMSKEDFYDMVRTNIKSQAKETLVLLGLLTMAIALKAHHDPDEDPAVKNYHKFMLKAIDKVKDRLEFYYNPASWQKILNGSIIPSIGIFTDAEQLISNFGKDVYGFSVEGKDWEKTPHVLKYVFRSFPVTSQMSTYLPLYAPDLAKELGIEMSESSTLQK